LTNAPEYILKNKILKNATIKSPFVLYLKTLLIASTFLSSDIY